MNYIALLLAAIISYGLCACGQQSSLERYTNEGLAAYEKADFPAAERSFLLALQEAEKSGPEDTRLAASLNNLAVLYKSQGRFADAAPLYKRALTITEKTLGPDHPGVAAGLLNLAELYEAQENYAEAEPLCKRSLQITEKAFGPDHLQVVTSLRSYANVLRNTNRQAEAEKLEKRARGIMDK